MISEILCFKWLEFENKNTKNNNIKDLIAGIHLDDIIDLMSSIYLENVIIVSNV